MTTNRDGCTLCNGAMCDLCGSGYCVTHNVGGRHVCAFCRHNVPTRIQRTAALIDAVEGSALATGHSVADVLDDVARVCWAPGELRARDKIYRWSDTETRPGDGKKVIRVAGVEVGAYVREDEADRD